MRKQYENPFSDILLSPDISFESNSALLKKVKKKLFTPKIDLKWERKVWNAVNKVNL